VKFKPGATEYYPGGSKIPDWVKAKTHTVKQVLSVGKEIVKGGKRCVLLSEINSWAAADGLVGA